MHSKLNSLLKSDVRLEEGLTACMNCGICTAICPAAEYFEYDPRSIAVTVQSGNEEEIATLLESDTIWYCGQCMSCKTRCPRNNCPGLIISVLRKVSQETGAFVQSRMGRQQYLIVKNIGMNILNYGYCVHPTILMPENHPEQGPVWKWVYENMGEVYASVGANLNGDGPGAMRKISGADLGELHRIFKESGRLKFYETIEHFSKIKALELGFVDENGEADMEKYTQHLLQEV